MIHNLGRAFKGYYLGVLSCLITAVAATLLASKYQVPVMLFALLLGLAQHFLYQSPRHIDGINFCAINLLRIAVALLGVRIVFSDIITLGGTPVLIVIAGMLATFLFSLVLCKFLKLPRTFGVLSGGSIAICGVSAAAAILTVLPKNKETDKFFSLTVITVTTLGTIAMVFYPVIASFLDLSDELAGVFLGGSIHDVAQVVGAGYSISPEAGDVATYIKLLRVALLMPIVMAIFFIFREKKGTAQQKLTSFVPLFLVAFFVLALVNNLFIIPHEIIELIRQSSNAFLVVAMVAIGMKTSLGEILSVGWKPILLLSLQSLFFACWILVGILELL